MAGFLPITGSSAAVGSALPQQQPEDEFGGEVGQEWGRRRHVIAYAEGSSAWFASVPAKGTAHPSADWLEFVAYRLRQVRGAPGQAVLELDYEQSSFSASYPSPGLPDDVTVEDSATMEVDIRRHPDFNTIISAPEWPDNGSMELLYDWANQRIFAEATVPDEVVDSQGEVVEPILAGATVPESVRGVSSYLVGTGTVTHTSYSYNEPSSVIGEAGKRAVPPGYSGTLANWLVMSAVRQRVGAYWTTRVVYEYSARSISDVIYDDSATL